VEVYTTEEQQVEAIKKWWRENKLSVIGGIIIGLGALWGGRTWLASQHHHAEQASYHYMTMMDQLSQGNPDEASQAGAQLLGQFSDTAYASLAALAMAKIKMDAGDLVAAKSHLRWALDNGKQESVKLTARLRMARILLAEGSADEALGILNQGNAGSFEAAYEELKGDIFVTKGDEGQAKAAYTRALAVMEPTAPSRQMLQMKLDDLGEGA
jgi:predicted negative regulator of RcsB-dependent stress response